MNLDAPNEELPGGFEKLAICDFTCENQRRTNDSACDFTLSLCLTSASDARLACIQGCAGVTTCVNNCEGRYLVNRSICIADWNSCLNVVDEIYRQCIDRCADGGGIGCSATATDTVTATLPLQDSPAGGGKAAAPAVEFPLSRSEIRGQESFVMDEWAIVQDGQVRASSNPGFARAVVEQAAQKSLGSFLVIQEPVHDMNSRHVPKPEVRISRAGLRPSEKGAGEIVAARLEFSPSKIVDRVQIVYTSRPMDESRLERLVSQRVDLAFASDKGHRTAVYVVFRLTDRVEVLGTVTAFPKCCCGDIFCI